MLGTISAFAYRQGNQEKPVSRWPVAGPSEYWLLASSPASKVKTAIHTVQQIHIRWQQYTQDNYNNTHGQTNNNYTQDNLKLATIHTRQIRIKHIQKYAVLWDVMQRRSVAYILTDIFGQPISSNFKDRAEYAMLLHSTDVSFILFLHLRRVQIFFLRNFSLNTINRRHNLIAKGRVSNLYSGKFEIYFFPLALVWNRYSCMSLWTTDKLNGLFMSSRKNNFLQGRKRFPKKLGTAVLISP